MDRRTVLQSTAAFAGISAIAGCVDTLSGGSEETPDPVSLSGGKAEVICVTDYSTIDWQLKKGDNGPAMDNDGGVR